MRQDSHAVLEHTTMNHKQQMSSGANPALKDTGVRKKALLITHKILVQLVITVWKASSHLRCVHQGHIWKELEESVSRAVISVQLESTAQTMVPVLQ
jgi:hypothetical protein